MVNVNKVSDKMFNIIQKILSYSLFCYMRRTNGDYMVIVLGCCIRNMNHNQVAIVDRLFEVSLHGIRMLNLGKGLTGIRGIPILALFTGKCSDKQLFDNSSVVVVDKEDGTYRIVPGVNKRYFKNIPFINEVSYVCKVVHNGKAPLLFPKIEGADVDYYIKCYREQYSAIHAIISAMEKL